MAHWVRVILPRFLLLAFFAIPAGCALLSAGSDRPVRVAAIESGEAMVRTDEGRIFVTGRDGTFELQGLSPDDAILTRLSVNAAVPAGCQFTGAATWGTWLFALCTTGEASYLLRARVGTAIPVLSQAAALPRIAIASGLAADNQGRLYVADSRHGGTAITQVTGATGESLEIDTISWMATTRGGFPNGLQYADGTLYVTSAGTLSAIPVGEDGEPGVRRTIISHLTFLDDFQVLPRGGFLLTDHSFNRLLLVGPEGVERGSFGRASKGPTSVLLIGAEDGGGRPPAVLITERGRDQVSQLDVPESLRPYLGDMADR
jgi:sugar lactone lactonase YvrE